MLKNKLWIVALIAALTIAFIGCTYGGIDPDWEDPDKDFKKFDLGAFNTYAGQPDKQAGWASNGYVDSENNEVVESEFKISDFTGARFLVIETAHNAEGGLRLVWQSKNFTAPGWATQHYAILADSSAANPGTTKKDGNIYGGQTIRVDLPVVFGSSYGNFLSAEDYVRFIIAYYSPDLEALDVKEAYLLISDKQSEISPELEGLSDTVGIGQTTIRNSANEYGWEFAELDKDNKQPEGTIAISEIRDATHLVLATKGGGIKVNDALVGFKDLKVILQAGSNKNETSLIGDLGIGYAHKVAEEVFFVIELDKLVGYDDTVAGTVGGDGDDADDLIGNVKLFLNYAPLEDLGLTAVYLVNDTASGLDKSGISASFNTEDLAGSFLGTPSGSYGYVTNYNALIAIWFEAPVELTIFASDGGTPPKYDQPYSGTGNGWIVGADYAKLKAAPAGSFVRVTVENRSSGNRGGWGCGHFGTNNNGNNFDAPSPLPPNAVSFVDFYIDDFVFEKDGTPYNDLYVNCWNDVAYTKVELYVIK